MPSCNFVLIPRDSEDIAEKLVRLAVFIFPLSSMSVLKVPPRQNTGVIVESQIRLFLKLKQRLYMPILACTHSPTHSLF